MEIETPHKQPPTNHPTSHPEGVPNPEYIVEKILERKIVNNQKLYLVKWEGYPETDSTWEPVENLLKVLDLIVDFEVRDCFLDSNMNDENPQSSEASPSNPKKRRPDQSLSEEEDITKKIKGENKDEGRREPEDGAKRKKSETLLSNKSKFLGDPEYDSPGKLKKVAARVDMSKPFIIGLVEAKPSEYINEEAAAELKKKRGRPKKAGNEGEIVLLKEAKSEKSENSNVKKRGRPPKSLLKLLKKRGRPRKYPVVPAVEESVVLVKEDSNKGGDVVKRSRGRPKKVVEEQEHAEPIEQEEITAVENWIGGGEEKVGNGEEVQAQTKKGRGRPRKTEKEEEEKEEKLDFRVKLIIPPREKGKRGRPKKNSEIIVEGAEELEEEGQEDEMREEEKEGEMEVEEKAENHEMDAFKKARTEAVLKRRGLPVPSESEGKEEGHGNGGEEGKKRGRGRPKKIRDEGEAVRAAEEKKVVEENNKTTPRKRGRPRKDQNVENIEGEEKEEQQEQQEGEAKNEGDETSQNTLISEGQGAQRKGRGRPPKPKDMEIEKGKGVIEKPKENGEEANGETQQQAKKRGRPRKIQPEVSKENENSNSGQDDENKEEADEEAKKSEKSQGKESRKSSFSSSISEQEEDEEEDNKASIEEEEERKPTELSQLNQKAGSFEAHDKPKRIIKMRVLTNTGSLFLVEWETRQNGQQPDNSYVSSYQLKNHCPEFLAEFYESLIQENFNRLDDIKKAAYKKPSEEFIAVEQKPDAFGGLIFHDRPKSVVKIQSLDEKDMELLIKWHLRYNSVQPLDSMATSEALKAHELPFLLTYYESKIRAQPGSEKGAVIDIPEKVELSESPIKKEKEKEKEASINKMEGEALLMEVGI